MQLQERNKEQTGKDDFVFLNEYGFIYFESPAILIILFILQLQRIFFVDLILTTRHLLPLTHIMEMILN